MVMFSGLVWVGMLTAFGRSTFTVLLITGMVIRKMMSSTSITSTSGVVLMLAIAPPDSCPTLIAMMDPRAALGLFAERRRLGNRRPRTPHGLGVAHANA